VRDPDLAVAGISRYRLYSDGVLVEEFIFNGNDSERIWYRSGWHYISYPELKPYELYRASEAAVIVVDEDFREMKRPN